MKRVLIAVSVLSLSGCALDVALMERGGPATGGGKVPYTMAKSGEITIALGGEEYAGRWVLAQGGSYSLASMSGASPAGGMSAVGTGVNFDAAGNGNILARSASGKGLRCVFNYSGFSRTGTGLCQDDNGRLYDMQIH